VALVSEQELPQPPQLVVVRVEVSQPLLKFPSQFAQPVAQLGLQVPAVHCVVPCALLQALPHEPQLLVEARLVSQPLLSDVSQLA
jgi:hypothetical protein